MALYQAIIFIDWNNVQARLDEDFNSDPRRKIKPLVLKIQQEVARILSGATGGARFRASLRVYHGWHRDRSSMPIRSDFELYQVDQTFARTIGTVSFTSGYSFGNELSCYPEPLPLYDTYRGGGQQNGQKMVDTAIVCDLLHFARENPDTFGVIISDDDDFLPAIITAKHWQRHAKGKSFQIRVERRDLRPVTDEDLANEVLYWSVP